MADLGSGVGRLFGPYAARRSAASMADSPESGATSSRVATASASMACQRVRRATLEGSASVERRPSPREGATAAPGSPPLEVVTADTATANDLHDELVRGHLGDVEDDEHGAGDGVGPRRSHGGERVESFDDARGERRRSPEPFDPHAEAAGYGDRQERHGGRRRSRAGGHGPIREPPRPCVTGYVDALLVAGT